MRHLMRFVATLLAAIGMVVVVAHAARAEELNATKSAGRRATSAYAVGRSLPGARIESVLTDPRGAATGAKRGTGWLLHYGTERDNCARADVTYGLRVMCVAW